MIEPADGYLQQRVYADDRSPDERLSMEDKDVVLVPEGQHPAGAPHGCARHYLDVMAGPVREWRFTALLRMN